MTKNKFSLHKLTHWEYWPSYMFYIPLIPYYFYLAIKAKNILFFTAVNPSIKNSGDGTESKYKTIKLIPEIYRPKTVFSKKNQDTNTTLINLKKQAIDYPIIVKPDIGFRGLLVEKLNSEHELITYLKKYPIDIIIQEFIPFENECGIFYHRKPNNPKGEITSITLKKFLTITGDGKSTIKELILNDNRAKVYLKNLVHEHKQNLDNILKFDDSYNLSVIGNHAKGTQFIDGNHLINERITEVFNDLNNQIEGWFYGRLDIKFDSFDSFYKGENFKILEINGIISEPTHVYDAAKNSYFDALKSIKKHWDIIYEISDINIKNTSPISKKSFFSDLKNLKKYTKEVRQLSLN